VHAAGSRTDAAAAAGAALLVFIYIGRPPCVDPERRGVPPPAAGQVELFGRLPERNRLLGRPSSAAELLYLEAHPTA
jgi:hypothetical protein